MPAQNTDSDSEAEADDDAEAESRGTRTQAKARAQRRRQRRCCYSSVWRLAWEDKRGVQRLIRSGREHEGPQPFRPCDLWPRWPTRSVLGAGWSQVGGTCCSKHRSVSPAKDTSATSFINSSSYVGASKQYLEHQHSDQIRVSCRFPHRPLHLLHLCLDQLLRNHRRRDLSSSEPPPRSQMLRPAPCLRKASSRWLHRQPRSLALPQRKTEASSSSSIFVPPRTRRRPPLPCLAPQRIRLEPLHPSSAPASKSADPAPSQLGFRILSWSKSGSAEKPMDSDKKASEASCPFRFFVRSSAFCSPEAAQISFCLPVVDPVRQHY